MAEWVARERKKNASRSSALIFLRHTARPPGLAHQEREGVCTHTRPPSSSPSHTHMLLRALVAASRAAPTSFLCAPAAAAAGAASASSPAALASTSRAFTSSPCARGLDELFEKPLKEGETRTAGEMRDERDRARNDAPLFPRPRPDPHLLHSHASPLSLLSGRAWTAADLRAKSWDDLHALWYVLLKERARLASSADAARASRARPPNPARAAKVRKSMARIKLVLSERAAAHPDPGRAYELRAFVDAL